VNPVLSLSVNCGLSHYMYFTAVEKTFLYLILITIFRAESIDKMTLGQFDGKSHCIYPVSTCQKITHTKSFQ